MKTIGYISMLILMLMAVSCANGEKEPVGVEARYDVKMTFNVGISSATETRARELDDTECRQAADDVRVYVFRSETGVGDDSFKLFDVDEALLKPGVTGSAPHIYIPAFDNNDKGDPDVKESHGYTVEEKLPEGYYRFLAVGRDDTSESGNGSAPKSDSRKISWVVGETGWSEAFMQNTDDDPRVTEFFSGYAVNSSGEVQTVHVTGKGSFLADITLRRAVAGVFLYVENIPATVKSDFEWTGIANGSDAPVTEVAIVAAGHDKELNLMTRKRGNNSFVTEKAGSLGLFKLTVVSPADGATSFPEKAKALKGEFVFPAALSEHLLDNSSVEGWEPVSMALCFYSNGYPVKLLPIKMARTETVHTDADAVEDDSPEGSIYKYNLVANHLYCLGNKNNTTDNPVDLEEALKNHELEITVIGAWQAIVDIEME